MAARLVLLRHGKSRWNLQNRFTGWADPPLAAAGKAEARAAARACVAAGLEFDAAFCSSLKRAIATLWIVLEQMDTMWLPQTVDWRFNERHYGALQGLNKALAAKKFGEAQVREWRRALQTPPPPASAKNVAALQSRRQYANAAAPAGESLLQAAPRVLAAYKAGVLPALAAGKNVLLVSHGNALRALIRHLENLDDKTLLQTEVPTGKPLVYDLNDKLKINGKRWL